MPYDDEVNRNVKRRVGAINRRFIAHTDMLGSTNAINSKNPSVEPQGAKLGLAGSGNNRVIGGGEGCANWSANTANKHYDSKAKNPEDMTGGAILGLQDGTLAGDRSKPMQHQTTYSEQETDNTGQFGALGDAFAAKLSAAPKGPTAANARSGYAHKDDSPLETQSSDKARQMGYGKGSDSDSDSDSNRCTCPRLKSGKVCSESRCKCGRGKKSGGSGFAAGTHMDVGAQSGVTVGISSTKRTVGAGRRRGGAILGLVKSPVAGKLNQTPAAYGNIVKGPTSTSKKDLTKPTTKADMPSSTLSGLGAPKTGGKRSARADIVKKVMKERGCTLMQASSIVKKEGLYKP